MSSTYAQELLKSRQMNADFSLLHTRSIISNPVNEYEFNSSAFVDLIRLSQQAVAH